MSFMGKVKSMLGQHGDKVGTGLEKAAKAVDAKTKGKYSDRIKTGTEKAKEAVGRLSDEQDDKNGTKDNKDNKNDKNGKDKDGS
ncbi:antitoxin [Streptomyces gobiensis]|uniref:antitoxin n=1 Tax=Streptomyces gobiensis TaxID=2875706 RepID=UPI001E5F86FB|nr:antitoxin [Streptomyces gobiensis]UGY94001.1 antitoxin [Streptomyces gobiensis]